MNQARAVALPIPQQKSGQQNGSAMYAGDYRASSGVARPYDQVMRRSSCACIRQGCVGRTRTLKP